MTAVTLLTNAIFSTDFKQPAVEVAIVSCSYCDSGSILQLLNPVLSFHVTSGFEVVLLPGHHDVCSPNKHQAAANGYYSRNCKPQQNASSQHPTLTSNKQTNITSTYNASVDKFQKACVCGSVV